MYKCRECNTIHKEKVEYCECGNNTFDEILLEKKPAKQKKTVEKKTPADKLKQKSEIVSWTFFVICVTISALIWVFAWNSPKKSKIQPKKQTIRQETVKDIPNNIDKIWDNTPTYKPAVQPVQTAPQVINSEPISLTSEIYPRQLSNQRPQQKTEIKTTPVAKPIIKPTPAPVIKKEIPKQTVLPDADDDPAFIRYKSNLRSALFSKFAVGSIKGSGSCTIEFSINPNGKLEGRKFIKQSDNKELNDAVYYMLMSVPVFNPPPDSYNGEKIRIMFYLNNGYYEVSFI